jgi:uncharacterized protein
LKPSRALLAVALAAIPAGCGAEPERAAPPAATPSRLEIIPLTIRSGSGDHRFSVEVARSPQEQAQGLMFRERLAPDAGMLFPFPAPRPASFWMKNTLIPLDMLFIRADGTIARIAAKTVPHSLDPVGVDEPVVAVLEIAGGRAAALGLSEGDRVGWTGGPSL